MTCRAQPADCNTTLLSKQSRHILLVKGSAESGETSAFLAQLRPDVRIALSTPHTRLTLHSCIEPCHACVVVYGRCVPVAFVDVMGVCEVLPLQKFPQCHCAFHASPGLLQSAHHTHFVASISRLCLKTRLWIFGLRVTFTC